MDPEAFAAGMKMAGIGPKRKRGRPKNVSRADLFNAEIERIKREALEPEDSAFLMEELAQIALGPIYLGPPLMRMIGYRVSEICRLAVEKGRTNV